MDLRLLPDDELLASTKRAVEAERKSLMVVLEHLRDVQRRRLFSTLKKPNLFAYAVEELKYSGDEAQRRISALQVLEQSPEMEVKIEAGDLTLTHLGMANAVFNNAKKNGKPFTKDQKSDLITTISGISTREAKKVIATIIPDLPKPDTIRYVAEDRIEIKFEAPATFEEKLERVRGKLAHKIPKARMHEIFAHLIDRELDAPRPAAPRVDSHAHAVRQTHEEANFQCENCETYFAAQTDHREPRSYGGASTKTNYRLLCRNCNQRAAIEKLGQEKMDQYINRH